MANHRKFTSVAKAYSKFAKAQMAFKKAVMAAADSDDGIRLCKIENCLADLPTLHGTLKAIRTAELTKAGIASEGDEGEGGGNTPDDTP